MAEATGKDTLQNQADGLVADCNSLLGIVRQRLLSEDKDNVPQPERPPMANPIMDAIESMHTSRKLIEETKTILVSEAFNNLR